MLERSAVIYCYDGSFDGLLCCVFESYYNKEVPADIISQSAPLPLLLNIKTINTDEKKANRVLKSIPLKIGKEALWFIRKAFLTCHPQKELLISRFLHLGYRYGKSVLNMLTNDTVHQLSAAVRHLGNEAHLYKGFVRFSESGGALTAQIEPKNIVLPLIARHFCERFSNEQFLIYDKTHDMALIYGNNSMTITSVEELELPCPDENEIKFRSLWKLFYDTIEIKGRHNPRCRKNHMPKRYWRYLTELAHEDIKALHSLNDIKIQLRESKR